MNPSSLCPKIRQRDECFWMRMTRGFLCMLLLTLCFAGCGEGTSSSTSSRRTTSSRAEKKEIAKVKAELAAVKKVNNELKAELAQTQETLTEYRRKDRLKVLAIAAIIFVPLLLIAGIIAFASFRNPKSEVVNSGLSECPLCHWDLPKDAKECANPDCRLRL